MQRRASLGWLAGALAADAARLLPTAISSGGSGPASGRAIRSAISLVDLAFDLRRREIIRLEGARIAGEADHDETCVPHQVQDIGEYVVERLEPIYA